MKRHRVVPGMAALAVFAAVGLLATAGCETVKETKVVAANDLGMHCMDREYSVFSILPPFNVLQAQVVQRIGSGKPGLPGEGQVEVAYEPVADAAGSINSTSLSGKTDFWTYALDLFGVTLASGEGLLGQFMPADAPSPGPQPFHYDSGLEVFRAPGVPITPTDDGGGYNPYPLMRVSARDIVTREVLATLDVTVPVSQEVDCQSCHRTGQLAADDPGISWSHHSDTEVQTKQNILILHDVHQGTDLANHTPVLCAGCHYSPPLDLAGSGPVGPQVGRPLMSATMHAFHGAQTDDLGNPLFPAGGSPEQTCFKCHPGQITQCARGAMNTGGMYCYDCHGSMLSVGGAYPLAPGGSMDGTNDGNSRRPWFDLPRCQSCHTGDAVDQIQGSDTVPSPQGIRLLQTWRVGDPAASPILAANKRFAENTGTPFRHSLGHGGLNCTACHGSPHAIWPNNDPDANDNVAADQLQGHSGTIIECSACHDVNTLRFSLDGPHGMHLVNSQDFVKEQHKEMFEGQSASCKACHGTNLEGTVLSRTAAQRSFTVEGRSVVLAKGTRVHCTHCHGDPRNTD